MKLKFTNIDKGGTLHVLIFDGPEGFPDSHGLAARKYSVDVPEGINVITLNVPPVTKPFAVSSFISENGKSEIQKNWLGIPVSQMGVSVKKYFLSKPNFQECRLPSGALDVEIKMFRLI